jgi:flagellar protein FlaG
MAITASAGVGFTAPSVNVDQARVTPPPVTTASVAVEKTASANPAKPVQAPAPTEPEVKQSLDAVNKYLKVNSNGLEFSQDEDTGKTLVKIVDTATGTVIQQIPTQQAVDISKDLSKLQGLLVKDRA